MKRFALLAALAGIFLLITVMPAFAGTSTITGTLTSAQIVSPDNNDNGNFCVDLTDPGGSFYYTLRQFQVTESGDYTSADIGQHDGDGATINIHLAFYTGGPSGFDPANPQNNGCFANFNDVGTISLTAGVTYMVKISSQLNTTFSFSTGLYSFSLTGPGSVLDINSAALSNPMLTDGRINGQAAAPVILYCEGTTTHGLDANGQALFSVENGKSADGAWGSIAPTADGRMMVTAAFPDTKPYYFLYDGCAHGHYEALSGNPATVFDSGDY